MKIFLLVFLIFYSFIFQVVAEPLATGLEHSVAIDLEKPGEDIPSVGSSVFDQVFYKASENAYQLPFPISALVNEVQEKSKGEVIHSYFPFSRSLQRPTDLSYDPLVFPRIVFGVKGGSLSFKNRIFWAYVEPKDQLEVISYNEKAGRFEFQLVTDYSKNPKVTYAPRAKCLSCHKNHAPILSIVPWKDSSSFSSGKLRKAMLTHLALPLSASDKQVTNKVIGIGTKSFESISILDDSIRDAAELATFQRLYVHGCQTRRCRFDLLVSKFSLCRAGEISGFKPYCGLFEPRVVSWQSPLKGMTYFESKLSNGDSEHLINNLLNEATVSNERDQNLDGSIALNDKQKLSIIKYINDLSDVDNPAQQKPQTIATDFLVTTPSLRFIKESMIGGKVEEAYDLEQGIFRALVELYKNKDNIFDAQPLNFSEMTQKIQAELGLEVESERLPDLKSREFAAVNKKLKNNLVLTKKPLKLLMKNCGSCHAGEQSYPLAFLRGKDKDVHISVSKYKDKILKRINANEMPPLQHLRDSFESSGEKKIILEFLNSLDL